MKQKQNADGKGAVREGMRGATPRVRLIAGVAVSLVALAGFARLHPVLAQTPVDPVAPTVTASVDAAAFAPSGDPDRPAFVPGELLVGIQPDLAAQTVGAATLSGFAVDEVVVADAEVVTQLVNVPPGQEFAAAQAIALQPGVLYVEPNAWVYAAQDTTDPTATPEEGAEAAITPPLPWIVNDTYYDTEQWNMQRIGMARAWQLALTSGLFGAPSTQIVVSVVDSGVDPSHPEFAGRLLPGKNYVELITEPLTNCRDTRFNVPMLDTYGHGTFVAGIIAASMNNGVGVAGIAPMVKIDPRRALNCQGGGSISDVAQAIREAADFGADIINLSLVVSSYSQTLADAVEYAADKGALLIAASGNVNDVVYYPAAFPDVIAVGALGYYDMATTYSNHGPEIALAAPGGDAAGAVFSTWPRPSSFPLDATGQPRTRCAQIRQDGVSYYCTSFGTSFAAPAVAGVAALLLSLDSTLPPEALRSILVETATPLPSQATDKVGAGKLNAFAAVRALLRPGVSFSPAGIFNEVLPSDDPLTMTVRVENHSETPLAWKAQLALVNTLQPAQIDPVAIDASAWLALTSGSGNLQNGSAAYGAPGFLTLRVNPAALASGFNSSRLTLESTPPGRSKVTLQSSVMVLLGELMTRIGLPIVMNAGRPGGTIPSLPYNAADAVSSEDTQMDEGEAQRPGSVNTLSSLNETDAIDDWATYDWAVPDIAANLQTHAIAPNGDVVVTLPMTVVVRGEILQSLRIHENGFVVLPNTPLSVDLTGVNRCMPMTDPFGTVIFGWWTNLDASAPGAKITSFTASGKRYVIQFENVPALGAPRPYKVTFQIVLDQQGNIRLNYKDVPAPIGKPMPATIGAQVENGRFFSEILCSTATHTFGVAPESRKSILIRSIDLY